MKLKQARCECCGKFVPECSRYHIAGDDEYAGITDMTEAWDVAICEGCFTKYPLEENVEHWRDWLVKRIKEHPEMFQYGISE